MTRLQTFTEIDYNQINPNNWQERVKKYFENEIVKETTQKCHDGSNFNTRLSCTNLIFNILINDDKSLLELKINYEITKRIYRIFILSINIESRMYIYFKYEEYLDFISIIKKINFFLNSGDFSTPFLSLESILNHPFSQKPIDIYNLENFTGYGFLQVDENTKISGFLHNGWFNDEVKVYQDNFLIDIYNFQNYFDNFLLTLVLDN